MSERIDAFLSKPRLIELRDVYPFTGELSKPAEAQHPQSGLVVARIGSESSGIGGLSFA
ncbi:hypothetical protein ACFL6X_01690 [Candidatus Latescibacterota bacterium]